MQTATVQTSITAFNDALLYAADEYMPENVILYTDIYLPTEGVCLTNIQLLRIFNNKS